jgi:hypothetical protein
LYIRILLDANLQHNRIYGVVIGRIWQELTGNPADLVRISRETLPDGLETILAGSEGIDSGPVLRNSLQSKILEAAVGVEPTITALQTVAFPPWLRRL